MKDTAEHDHLEWFKQLELFKHCAGCLTTETYENKINMYLEYHPNGIYFSCCPRNGGCLVPDREKGRFTTVKVNQAMADGALVLITGHDEEENNAGRKTQ